MIDNRDAYFMNLALKEAERALSMGEFPVGCVLVHEDRVIATGSRIGTTGAGRNELDHAEIVALRRSIELPEPVIPHDVRVYSTMEPCLMCFGAILIHGIRTIVYAYEDAMGGGTRCNTKELPPLYRDHPPIIRPNILRQESLSLFKKYFSDPAHHYWKDSYLCQYTLRQT